MIVLGLIVQIVMGFRCLRDRDYYFDDPLVCGLLGVAKLPDVSTNSRTLGELDDKSVQNLSHLSRSLVLDRIIQERLARLGDCLDISCGAETQRLEIDGMRGNLQITPTIDPKDPLVIAEHFYCKHFTSNDKGTLIHHQAVWHRWTGK